MSVTDSGLFRNDFHRDASKYYKLLTTLNDFMEVIEDDPYTDIDGLIQQMLPFLAEVTDTHKAFAAQRLIGSNGGEPVMKITGAYPDHRLIGRHFSPLPLTQVFGPKKQLLLRGESINGTSKLIDGLEIFEATSAIMVLMQAGEFQRVVGVINQRNPQLGPFLNPDRQSLKHMVDLVALGIRVGEQRRYEIEQVQSSVAELNRASTRIEFFPQVASKAKQLFKADAVGLALWDSGKHTLRFNSSSSVGLPAEYIRQQQFSSTVINHVFPPNGKMQPLVLDLQCEDLGDLVLSRRAGLCTALVAPLVAGPDNLLGLLIIYSLYEARSFSSFEEEMVQVFASQVAAIFKKIEAYEDTLHEIKRLSLLLKASQHITNIQPIREECTTIMDDLLTGGCDVAILYPYNPFTYQFDTEIQKTRRTQSKLQDVPPDSVLWRLVRDAGRDRLFSSDPADQKYFPHWDETVKAAGYVVLKHEARNIGLLFVYTRTRTDFSPSQCDRIERIAQRLARDIYESLTLQSVVDNLLKAMGCDVIILRPYDASNNELGPCVVGGQLNKPNLLGTSGRTRIENYALMHQESHFSNDSAHDDILKGSFVEREQIHASGYVRLEVDREPVGVLFVNWRSPHEWKPQEIQAVQLFANQAAIAIWNSRLYRKIERRSRHWLALYEVSKTITANFAAERQKVLDLILKQTVEMITPISGPKANLGVFQNYNPTERSLTVESVYPPAVYEQMDAGLKKPRSIGESQAQGSRSEPGPDASKTIEYLAIIPNTRSDLAVPVMEGNTLIGLLSVESDVANAFDEEDENALRAIAELTVIALNNARQREELNRRLSHLEAISTAGAKIAQAGIDTPKVNQTILEQAARVTQSYFATMQWVEEDDGVRRLRFVATHPETWLQELEQKVGEMDVDGPGITARAVRKNDAQLVRNVDTDDEFQKFGTKTRSELAVAFRSSEDGEAVGVLNLENETVDGLTEEHRQVLIDLSNLAMVAKRNAEQAAQLRTANTVAVMGVWGAYHSQELNRSIGQIRRAAQLIRQRETLSDYASDWLDRIDDSAKNLYFPPIPEKVGRPGEPLTPDDAPVLKRVIDACIEAFRAVAPKTDFVLDLPSDSVCVRIHHKWLRAVMNQFITNALRAIDERPDPCVSGQIIVRARIAGEFVEIQIEDNGKGVRPAIMDDLFEKPIDHIGPRARDRIGSGLLFVRYLVALHGGKAFLVRPQPAQGACFGFTVAIEPHAPQDMPESDNPPTLLFEDGLSGDQGREVAFEPARPRVLLVFPQPKTANELKQMLEAPERNNRVRIVQNHNEDIVAQAQKEARAFCPHVIIMELRLREVYREEYSGLELAEQLPSAWHILYTEYSSRDIERRRQDRNIHLEVIGQEESPRILIDSVIKDVEESCAGAHSGRAIPPFQVTWPTGWDSAVVLRALFGDDAPQASDLADDVLYQMFHKDKRHIKLELMGDQATRIPHPRAFHSVALKATLDGRGVLAVKLAPAEQLRREIENYDNFVDGKLGGDLHPQLLRRPVYFWNLAGAGYNLLGNLTRDPLLTFSDFYTTADRVDDLLTPLEQFFGGTWGPQFQVTKPLNQPKSPVRLSLFDQYNSHYGPDTANLLTRLNDARRFSERESTVTFSEEGGNSFRLPNPVLWVLDHRASSLIESARIAVTHGDLHGSNLFVDGRNAWVIDFERTGWGHILRDFVELEMDVMTRLLNSEQIDLGTRLALYRAIVEPTEVGAMLPDIPSAPPAAQKALDFARKLRDLARRVTWYEEVEEYLWGLLLHTLFVASLSSLESDHKQNCMLLAAVIVERLSKE